MNSRFPAYSSTLTRQKRVPFQEGIRNLVNWQTYRTHDNQTKNRKHTEGHRYWSRRRQDVSHVIMPLFEVSPCTSFGALRYDDVMNKKSSSEVRKGSARKRLSCLNTILLCFILYPTTTRENLFFSRSRLGEGITFDWVCKDFLDPIGSIPIRRLSKTRRTYRAPSSCSDLSRYRVSKLGPNLDTIAAE